MPAGESPRPQVSRRRALIGALVPISALALLGMRRGGNSDRIHVGRQRHGRDEQRRAVPGGVYERAIDGERIIGQRHDASERQQRRDHGVQRRRDVPIK